MGLAPLRADDHGKQEGAQRVEGGAELDEDQHLELHVGNEDAEQIDLDHGPPAQVLDPGEHRAQIAGRAGGLQADEHIQHATELGGRRGDGGEQHDRGKLPYAVLVEADWAGEHVGDVDLAGGADQHQREWDRDQQQARCGAIERERRSERIMLGVTKHAVAAEAERPGSRRDWGNDLELAAVAALPQVRRRRRVGRGSGRW